MRQFDASARQPYVCFVIAIYCGQASSENHIAQFLISIPNLISDISHFDNMVDILR